MSITRDTHQAQRRLPALPSGLDPALATYLESLARALTEPYQQTPPSCRLKISVDQALPAATPTLLSWDSIDYDSAGLFDLATSTTIHVRIPGRYLVIARVRFDDSAPAVHSIDVLVNGVSMEPVEDAVSTANFQSLLWASNVNLREDDLLTVGVVTSAAQDATAIGTVFEAHWQSQPVEDL